MATSSTPKRGKTAPVQRRSTTIASPAKRPAAARRSARTPSLGHAGNAIKQGVAVVKAHRATKRSSSARLRNARKDGGCVARTTP